MSADARAGAPRPHPIAPIVGRLHHVGIAAADAGAARALYGDLLGMRESWDETIEAQGVRVIFFALGAGTEIEILIPTREDSPVARFIARHGPGLHHVAYEVEDIVAALAACRDGGLRLVDLVPRIGARGHRVAFLHPDAAGGVLVELVEEPRPPA